VRATWGGVSHDVGVIGCVLVCVCAPTRESFFNRVAQQTLPAKTRQTILAIRSESEAPKTSSRSARTSAAAS
jgi:hypothetical protein